MKPAPDGNLLVGIGYGLAISVPMWAGIIWGVRALLGAVL